jgi:hypothetical protein
MEAEGEGDLAPAELIGELGVRGQGPLSGNTLADEVDLKMKVTKRRRKALKLLTKKIIVLKGMKKEKLGSKTKKGVIATRLRDHLPTGTTPLARGR